MRSAFRKFGNSAGVIIPKPLLVEIGAEAGDGLDIRVQDGAIVLTPIRSQVRSGWSEAAASIADAGDDDLVLEEYVEDYDSEWVW